MAAAQNTIRKKRVFFNDIDSYSSKYIAKHLSTCFVGESLQRDEAEKVAQNKTNLKQNRFEVVGTVRHKDEKLKSFVLEEYAALSRHELLDRLMKCDVIVYNISEDPEVTDEASWAISALHSEIQHFKSAKIFILVSTLMTWAMTKPLNPDDPNFFLTEDDYKRKRPHPNFRAHASAERLVLKLGKTKKSKLATYVLASGLQYGMGEGIFHFFFKASWLGKMSSIPVIGTGTNIIPTIHVLDLAGVVQNVIEHKPKRHYFIAVDDSRNTLEDIVKAVARVLGPDDVTKVPKNDAVLTKELTQVELDYLSINLPVEALYLKDSFNLHWVCESGMSENISDVVEEYKETRELQPIKICVLGPPAVGKTSVAVQLCKHYKLQHIEVKQVVEEKIKELEEEIFQKTDEEDKTEESSMAQELLEFLKNCVSQLEGHLYDQDILRVVKEKLNSNPCRNQGFVLDGFPTSYQQAKDFFSDEAEIVPELIFALDATDDFLKERVQNLPQSVAEQMHYTQDEFLQHLSQFREASNEEETVLDYFDESELLIECIEVSSTDDTENEAVVEKIIQTVGKAMNYGLSPEEQAEEEAKRAEEKRQQLIQEAAENKLREEEEKARIAALQEEWDRNLGEVKKQEYELLEARSIPMRHYLMKYVIPTVTKGLLECCKAKPEDPLEFLAEYLLRNETASASD